VFDCSSSLLNAVGETQNFVIMGNTDCAGFGWGRVNFPHSSWDGAVFWICGENSVDNTAKFQLLLSGAYIESRPFLLLAPPHQWVGWGAQEVWRGHSQNS